MIPDDLPSLQVFSFLLFCCQAKKTGMDDKKTSKKSGRPTEVEKTKDIPKAPELEKKRPAKGKGKGMVKDAPKGPEVCKDPVKLTSHAMGVNIYKQGQDTPLQPPHQYPDWLFQIDLGPPKKLQDLDPESREYWKLLRKENMWRFNRLHKGKKL
ncbi:large ribosomal subunit protein mL54 isoform X2 [Lepisosteus oculatus]|uniref:large ribosomal subunit protein mL54 isoform X2 n=1 Tax=Lepisosteus oculatus TaxID=7918 RepID=UPI00073FD693|nr:PREDICTED: 39S ribosomal protein L54, mitochondrial isoform X2 [Lepisosteus oculatus]